MMEETVVEDRAGDTANLITSVPVQMVSEPRVEVISKPVVTMTPVTVTTANGVPQELIAAQYINIHRVPEQLNKVLVSDALSSDLLSHHVDLATAADFTQHGVTTQYYDTDDLLTHDLSEDDRRLAAELVAVQFKHQQQQHQQQQTHIVPTPVTSLGALQAVNMDRSTISAAIVTSYIQAVEDEVVHQHLLQQQQENNDRCIMKIYQQPTAHELQQVLSRQQLQNAQPLSPLKKVLSHQMVLRSKFQTTPRTVMVEVPGAPIMDTTSVSDDSATVKLEAIEKANQTVNAQSNVQPLTPSGSQGTQGQAGQPTEDLDSDYDAESDTRPSRRSLPHKKRIPRKLKTQPARSIHTKCYKCNKCGESFTTQTAFSSHKATHMALAKQRPSANSLSSAFSCELCSKQFNSQLKFFEHLKQHYEPNNCGPGNDNSNSINLNINSVNTSSGNSLPELTPAPIVATCIPPLSVSQNEATSVAHSVVVVTSASQSAQLSVSSRPQGVVSLHPTTSSNAATPSQSLNQSSITIKDAFSIKDELGQGVVKEEIVTSTGLVCNQCGETFRKSKALDMHIATVHARHEEIEEFSEPEDMMDGISIRHVVNISNVISGAEGDEEEEHCDAGVVDNKLKSWRYQEVQDLGMDLQDIPCLPLPTGPALSHHGQVSHHNGDGHQGSSTRSTIVPDDDSNHLDDEDVDDPSPVNTRIRLPVNMNNNNNNNNVLNSCNTPMSVANAGRKKQLQCPECDRIFNHRNSLLYHIRSHSGSRPHQCEVCGKSFFSASALKVHMRLHSGDKPYKCEFCSRNFRQWGDLKYHVTSLHSGQKLFQCEYCGKDFARKYSLIVHRRIHTGEKNYKCEYCNKTFRASSYLQNHRRIHTGEKPHPCDICGKPFRVRSDMKRHRQTHSRERPASRSTSVATSAINSDDDNSGGESILPDNAVAMPLNLNIRQGDSNDSITYSRTTASLEREGNTVYVWIPAAPDSNLLSDE